MRELVSRFFNTHRNHLEVGVNGLALAQDFYTTHAMYWQESKGTCQLSSRNIALHFRQYGSVKHQQEQAPVQEGALLQ